MEPTLLDEVLTRLDADSALDDDVKNLVLAGCLGEVDAALDGVAPTRPALVPGVARAPQSAYLKSIAVSGFRGIGPRTKLELQPGPGLTLVVGRNGSGKSSFAEGLELLLTGDSKRWSDGRSKIWRDGWRNLHHANQTSIEAEILIDGQPGPSRITRTWSGTDKLDEGRARLTPKTGPTVDIDQLGWREAMVAYRPFLSYNELGSMLAEGPSKLFDALGSILGLEEVNEAGEALDVARKRREVEHKATRAALVPLLRDLEPLTDERAAIVRAALSGKRWDLDLVSATVAGGEDQGRGVLLTSLSSLAGPDLAAITAAVAGWRDANEAVRSLAASDGERDRRTVVLLEQALSFHQHAGDGDCPVCGRAGALGAKWQSETAATIARLRESARLATAARERQMAAERALRAELTPAAPILSRSAEVELDSTSLVTAWNQFAALKAQTVEIISDHIEANALGVVNALTTLRDLASAQRQQREESFRPVALRVAGWLAGAARVEAGEASLKLLKSAAKWLRDAATAMRNQRFLPIADRVKLHWEVLRARSSVDIADIRFGGGGTARRVELDVTIDGTEGAALGVMSQGELHALALCLFLPRATLAASPFRFLVIDDPVQAMDPARVDGLARLLAEVAKDRQVVVFTHDDRLPEAVRLQRIAATVIEVQRRDASNVDLLTIAGPTERLIDEALALIQTHELPAEVVRRVVPGICRQAIEAACRDVIRRRRLARGESHREIEKLLLDHPKFLPQLSLAHHDDPERSGDVLGTLNNKYGKWAGDIVRICNKGAHGGADVVDISLIRSTEKLTKQLLTLT